MALFNSSYEKYVGQKLSKLTKETTEEEIKDLYKDWATEFDKVYTTRAQGDNKCIPSNLNDSPNWSLNLVKTSAPKAILYK